MGLKWGIVSAALISHDFINAMKTLNEGEHEVVAIAARNLNRAEEFATQYGISKAYGSYLELAQDPNVEVAYVAMLNREHFSTAMMMLEHGKHVLCEKPMCINKKQSQQLIAFAKEKNLFLMEGIWSRLFPSYQYIRKQIQDGNLGEIVSVDVNFGNGDLYKVARLAKKDIGGGTTLDMGVYTIQFCQWVFQEPPKSIKATGKLNDEGVDIEMSAELTYSGNKVGSIKTSTIETMSCTGKIIGTKGEITVLYPVWSSNKIIDIDGNEKTWPFPKTECEFNFPNSCGLRYEIDEVRKCIRGGKIECEHVTHNESLVIASIQDEIRRQIGVSFPEDE